ncbi:hypothetical protein FJ970_25895 [Mesorhizobium sp. B2-1-8]|uniref:hypothetical protein n=1 Tax=unclassified Mesorhizobium TaxID=325217 RepID=UPI0011274283|nr:MULTISPECIES: hypothetical protein [unclassified Mesorhizobium]TPI26584.1 hypothetical protein FJW08_27070 [Mesorhizobium sp. B3-2-1]UCI18464.1 hypothetical protein FJ970_25895 [Mesorhizobium sp. B2-1-8]
MASSFAGRRHPTAFQRAIGAPVGPDWQWLRPVIFRRAAERAFHREQNSRASPSSTSVPALRWRCGCRSGPSVAVVAMKAAMDATDPGKEGT